MPLAGSALLVLFLLTLVVLANVDNEQPVRQPAPTPTPTSSLPTQ